MLESKCYTYIYGMRLQNISLLIQTDLKNVILTIYQITKIYANIHQYNNYYNKARNGSHNSKWNVCHVGIE